MITEQLTEQEALIFGRRLDSFAAGLTPRERNLLVAILHDAEAAQHDDADHRTPGDIAVAVHRTHRTPPINVNPQPMPIDSNWSSATWRENEGHGYRPTVSKE